MDVLCLFQAITNHCPCSEVMLKYPAEMTAPGDTIRMSLGTGSVCLVKGNYVLFVWSR